MYRRRNVQPSAVRSLFESLPSLSRRPLPTLVTASADNGHRSHRTLEHIAATGDVAGAWALVYSPRGASFTVDLSQLRSPQVAGRWFDPRTGTFREIGAISTSSTYVFDPPGDAGEGNDHVLVLCATVAN